MKSIVDCNSESILVVEWTIDIWKRVHGPGGMVGGLE